MPGLHSLAGRIITSHVQQSPPDEPSSLQVQYLVSLAMPADLADCRLSRQLTTLPTVNKSAAAPVHICRVSVKRIQRAALLYKAAHLVSERWHLGGLISVRYHDQ